QRRSCVRSGVRLSPSTRPETPAKFVAEAGSGRCLTRPLVRVLPASVQGAAPRPRYPSSRAPVRVVVRTCAFMSSAHARHRAAGLAVSALVCALALGSGLTATSAGDLQSQISASKSAAASLRSQIASESARIRTTGHGLADANQRLTVLQRALTAREAELGR